VTNHPGNREYEQELATFDNNLAILLLNQRQVQLARLQNGRALGLMEELAAPALSLRMDLANAYNLRCQLLKTENVREAESECRESLALLENLAEGPDLHGRPSSRGSLEIWDITTSSFPRSI
jgi:hypothetical protein